MNKHDFQPIPPGEILFEDFLKPMNINPDVLAKAISVSPFCISEILAGKQSITADIALRLGLFFGMEAQFWLNLQSRYDLEIAKEALSERLNQEVLTAKQLSL